MVRMVNEGRRYLDGLIRVLAYPTRMLEPLTQRFDNISDRLDSVFTRHIDRQDKVLHGLSGRLRTPQNMIDGAQLKITHLQDRIDRISRNLIPPKQDALNASWRVLDSLSYKNILQRGYAVLRDDTGRVLETTQDVHNAAAITAEVKDGQAKIK